MFIRVCPAPNEQVVFLYISILTLAPKCSCGSLVHLAPNCRCGFLLGICLLSVHRLGGFGSQMLMRIFAWNLFIFSSWTWWIRFAGFGSQLLIGYLQCIDLVDSAPECWCGFLLGICLLSIHGLGGFGSQLLIVMFVLNWLIFSA